MKIIVSKHESVYEVADFDQSPPRITLRNFLSFRDFKSQVT